MKRSKFLKSSKEMLSRSFDPTKCKTSLRLAGSRLKLLRNKKEVQVNQMKREIAQLLESGQDHTARIRVEHVIREEKMITAYELIEIYCELIVARLSIIESQKTCPIDLKEAIASVVFASPRCGDVPELLDVRKHFTAKYGKDFTSAAIELRPECGVSRMLVEKLSAMAPDGQTKIKILSAIAEEHNVKWDPKSFDEKDSVPPSELLTGPSTFLKESELHVEAPEAPRFAAPEIQARQSNNVMHTSPPHFEAPDVQVPQSNSMTHSSPLMFSQMDQRTSLGTENINSTQTSGVSTTFQQEARSPALDDEREQLFQGDSNTTPLDTQMWNMEFKDAVSAGRAAAEFADRAIMAFRAAAELSGRESDTAVLKDEVPETNVNSKLADAQLYEESANRSFSEHTRLQEEQIGRKPNDLKTEKRFEDGRGGTREYSPPSSLKSKASIDDDSLDHVVPAVSGFSQKNSLKEVSSGEMSMKHKAESADGWPENSDNFREENVEKRPSVKSFISHSSISDDVNIFSHSEDQKIGFDAGEDPSLGSLGFEKEGIYGEASQTSSREPTAVAFDESDSDSDIYGFGTGPTCKEQDPLFHFPTSGQKSYEEHHSVNPDSWSPRSTSSKIENPMSSPFFARKNSSSDLSEKLTAMDGPKLDDSVPLTFDESDGSASDLDFSADQPALEPETDLSYMGNSSLESWEGLNNGKLTSGLRHKVYNHPPYSKNKLDVSSSSKESKETTATITRSTASSAVDNPRLSTISKHKKSARTPYLYSESDGDNSEEEESLRKSSGHKPEVYHVSARKEVKKKPSFPSRNSFFGSDNSDTDEHPPMETLSRTSHLQSGISRRTKASPSSGKISNSKMRPSSEGHDLDDEMDRKSTASKTSQAPRKSEYEQSTSAKMASKPAKSNYWGPPENYDSVKATFETMDESKIRQKTEAHDSEASLKAAATQTKTSSSKDDGKQKPSHVHPKLPDYDTLFQSLRKNRS